MSESETQQIPTWFVSVKKNGLIKLKFSNRKTKVGLLILSNGVATLVENRWMTLNHMS